MTLYILFAVSAVLAWSEFTFGKSTALTTGERVAGSLGYAFAPLLIALLIAGIMSRFHKLPGKPSAFLSNFNNVWAVLLGLATLSHIATLTR
jgi:hypothetical protein